MCVNGICNQTEKFNKRSPIQSSILTYDKIYDSAGSAIDKELGDMTSFIFNYFVHFYK